MKTRSPRLLILAAGLALAACSGGDGGDDAGPGPGTDGGPGADGGVDPGGPSFFVDVVDGLNSSALVGDFAQAALTADGRFAVAYGVVPAGGGEREIHYAIQNPDDTWSTELVTRPGEAIPGGNDIKGLGHALVEGTPHLVFLGGDDDGRATVEEPTDLVMATRGAGGAWALRTLVDVSNEATGDCTEYCNEGFVVGTHATIAANPSGSGFAVAYRDTHFGFATDDFALADVEMYVEGGPVARNTMVDPERGGGEHSNLTFTADGGLLLAYDVAASRGGTDITGVWAAVYTGGEWRLRQVWDERTNAKVAVAATADALYVALYDSGDSDLVLATSTDDGDTWTTERLDSAGKTGLFPSIGVDGDGRLVIAYTYCGPSTDRDCPSTLGADAEVRLARRHADGWRTYEVDDGQGFGRVGLFNTLAVAPDGKLGIAFVDDGNGDLVFAKEE